MSIKDKKLPGPCIGEKCWCGNQAHHKVEHSPFDYEQDVNDFGILMARSRFTHPLTSYICHDHFVQLMGPAAKDIWG